MNHRTPRQLSITPSVFLLHPATSFESLRPSPGPDHPGMRFWMSPTPTLGPSFDVLLPGFHFSFVCPWPPFHGDTDALGPPSPALVWASTPPCI